MHLVKQSWKVVESGHALHGTEIPGKCSK